MAKEQPETDRTVQNLGPEEDTFDVTLVVANATDTVIEQTRNVTIGGTESTSIGFEVDTSSFDGGVYDMDISTTGNTVQGQLVTTVAAGDTFKY